MKTLIENQQKQQHKIGYGEALCDWCGKKMWKNSPTQKYHGPFKEKESCAYKKYSVGWREGFNKRRKADPAKYRELGKRWRQEHPGYMHEYQRMYRAKRKDETHPPSKAL